MGTLLPNASLMAVAGLFPLNLTVMTTAAAIVESVAAALAGECELGQFTIVPPVVQDLRELAPDLPQAQMQIAC